MYSLDTVQVVTVKVHPLLTPTPVATTTLPVVAPAGTVTVMLVALQLLAVAAVPLNFTVLSPWVAPKLLPLIVTTELTNPEYVERLVITGGGLAVTKLAVSLIGPFIVTVTLDAAPE
jgi:hypothetical protein